jgi:hypothetical protein
VNELMIVDKLRHYAALELRRGESEAEVVKSLLSAFEAAKQRCLGIETLGTYKIGGHTFVRFRSDVDQAPYWLPDRGCIVKDPSGGFTAKLPGGRQGKVPPAPMFMASMQRRIYHGTVKQNWQLQFT